MTKKELTLDLLLGDKFAIESSDNIEYESKQMGVIIKFDRISPDRVSGLIEDMNSGECSQFNMYLNFIYLSCPVFHNAELIKKYNVVEPFEVVYKALKCNIAEIYDMGNQLMQWYGFIPDIKK